MPTDGMDVLYPVSGWRVVCDKCGRLATGPMPELKDRLTRKGWRFSAGRDSKDVCHKCVQFFRGRV